MNKTFIKILFLVIAVNLVASGAEAAENSLKLGAKALSFGITDRVIELSGRYFAANDIALLAGFGFSHTDNDANATDYNLSVGGRKYLVKGDLAPFVGASVFFVREETIRFAGTGAANVQSQRTFGLNGHFGLEYFFAKQVSAEAQVGAELRDSTGDLDTTTFETFRSGVTVNFYLP
ncbi:MAG: hypothetical protein HY204_03865 [Nitrospirae bacterium]|nr:hypothetical protein [Nitrospirota bacterium]